MSIEYPPVLTKKNFTKRYVAGEFGNCSPTWNDLASWGKDNEKTSGEVLFHIRNRIAGGETWYNKSACELPYVWMEALKVVPRECLYISAMCPTERTIINAEVMEQPGAPLALFYSSIRKPMRDSLKKGGRQVYGATAQRILREVMDENSYEWLMLLLERYPSHVVEFTSLEVCWGTIPNYNTLFWEVRGGY